ncbi:multidrug ABC transporter ATP-binding protein [Ignicoccus islandicus DSM 13165]|uniref:Multidrug ABC transporter ATP-binding protein n=1 Tax=Ignicoccus islandicus DSM 13165 TaxID=940295 RepID=A0A0U3E213_9CREN|nr:ABC transporter ATP-binding protein [Ignicoccus islandicus]ALU11963.1 multidrug ABC transporter ATP-binding protein [Ignicoccus islandicus DSM 13165]
MNAVEIKGLRKTLGRKEILKGINLEIKEGEIFGLIGPNGAGKTTTLRIIATLLKPTAGIVKVYGRNVAEEPEEVRKLISYLPEESDVYLRLTGLENLKFFAMVYAKNEEEVEEMIRRGIEIADLGNAINRLTRTYSKGMRRRLALARALMVRPRLAILDEPTSGLDVYSAMKVRNSIKKFVKETGNTVILSSHNMLEVEYLCDRVAFVANGKIVQIGTPKQLKEMYGAENLEEAFIKAVEVEAK